MNMKNNKQISYQMKLIKIINQMKIKNEINKINN